MLKKINCITFYLGLKWTISHWYLSRFSEEINLLFRKVYNMINLIFIQFSNHLHRGFNIFLNI